MLSSPLAVALAIALVPGYLYLQATANLRSQRPTSALTELLEAAAVGAGTTGLGLVVVGLLYPEWLLRTLRTMRSGPDHVSADDLTSAAFFGLAVLAAATLLALLLYLITRAVSRRRFAPSAMQGTLGMHKPGHGRYIGLTLEDGSTIEGLLHAYSRSDSDSDRVIALKKPMRMSRPGSSTKNLSYDHYVVFGPQIRGIAVTQVLDPGSDSPGVPALWRRPNFMWAIAVIVAVVVASIF